MTENKKILDPRDEAIYPISAAAWCLALPMSTVRHWGLGIEKPDGARRAAAPVVRIAERHPPTLSFWNLVEVYVLSGIRREHKIPLQRVRKALAFVEKNLNLARPLINQEFLTDGVDLFVEQLNQIINVTDQSGQLALKELLRGSLTRIDRDPQGLARRVSPWLENPGEPREVEIDPTRSFGRRVIAGTNVPTEIIGERFRRRDSIEHLMQEYRVTREQVEAALRWEQCAAVQ